MGYIVREKDQWGAVRFKVEGSQIQAGEYMSGMADMTVTADPYDSDRKLVRRGNAQGEVLYCIEPNPHGEGYYVRERDIYGRKLYFVESSRYDEDAFLVREGDQYGSVAFYVALAERDGDSGGRSHREPTLLDKVYTHVVYDLLFQAFLAPKKRFGKNGAIVAMLGWFAFLLLIAVLLHFPGWYAIPFGLLVVWGAFQIGRLYRQVIQDSVAYEPLGAWLWLEPELPALEEWCASLWRV